MKIIDERKMKKKHKKKQKKKKTKTENNKGGTKAIVKGLGLNDFAVRLS